MAEDKDKREIISFNDLPVDFNFDDVNLEKLEHRLELAVAPRMMGAFDCSNFCCPSNTGTCDAFSGDTCCASFAPGPRVPLPKP